MKKILIGLGIVTVIVGVIYTGQAWKTWQVRARNAEFNEDLENLFIGDFSWPFAERSCAVVLLRTAAIGYGSIPK